MVKPSHSIYMKGGIGVKKKQKANKQKPKKVEKVSLADKLATGFDIPKETVYDVPYITLVGNKEIEIENFMSILAYEEEMICLKTQCGELRIEGTHLEARHMDSESMRIKGNIQNIAFKK